MEETALRSQLVSELETEGRIRSPAVAAAFSDVPRHLFLPGVPLETVYADEAIVTKRDVLGRPISSSSQPSIMAIMLEQLDLEEGAQVLEIGAGTGYNAALLAHLVNHSGSVVSIDIDDDVASKARDHLEVARANEVRVECADGALGWEEGAPYDRIIVTVGAPDLSPRWLEQLRPGGLLVVPLRIGLVQVSVCFERIGQSLVSRSVQACGFMPMRGAMASSGPGGQAFRSEVGLMWHDEDLDGEHLLAMLSEAPEIAATDMSCSSEEVASLGLHLGLLEENACEITAIDAVGRGQALPSLARDGGWSLSRGVTCNNGIALVHRDEEKMGSLAIWAYGDGTVAASKLRCHLDDWDWSGRRPVEACSIRAGFSDLGEAPGAKLVRLGAARVLVSWPEPG